MEFHLEEALPLERDLLAKLLFFECDFDFKFVAEAVAELDNRDLLLEPCFPDALFRDLHAPPGDGGIRHEPVTVLLPRDGFRLLLLLLTPRPRGLLLSATATARGLLPTPRGLCTAIDACWLWVWPAFALPFCFAAAHASAPLRRSFSAPGVGV